MSVDSANVFGNLGLPPFLVLLYPFFISVVGVPIARELALGFGIVDTPIEGSSKTHKEPVPYLGGLPVFIALVFGTWIVLSQLIRVLPDDFNIKLVCGSIGFIFFVGLWDDIRGMIPGVKMSLLAVAGTALFLGGAGITFIPETWGIFGRMLAWALTLFWILGITNAANLMDNMNGLAAGTGIVTGLAALAISVKGIDPVGIGLSFIMIGALIGYLPFNFPRAKIFFGDAGSITLGFYVSFLGLMIGRFPAPEGINPLSHTLAPIIMVGVFVFDTFFVAITRGKRKVNFWWGGKDHTSHRFVNYGFSKTFAVILVWMLGIIFGLFAVLAKSVNGWISSLILIFSYGAGIWFWGVLSRIPVDEVKIGASNIRVRHLSKK